ncbi:MAG: protein kinase, partial [Myxococcaceae bacterium]
LGIAREYVDGYSLGQLLQRLNTREVFVPAPLALYVVLQVAEAVLRAHEVGVTHGAMTPGNVLIGRDGRVGIADFGALEALQAVPELRAFTGKGRSAYRAPEVSAGGPPTAASDVYSVGALAYELLTLREPIAEERTFSTRHAPLPPPSRLDRRINPRLDAILLRALEQAPARRFRSCAELSNALRKFLTASGGLPSRSELARVVGDLFPNEVQLHASPQVPFSEPFELQAVNGVDFVPAQPPTEPSRVLVPRPSFSRGAIPVVDESFETIEALPAFETFDWEAPPGEAPSGRRVAFGPSASEPSGISLSARSRVRVAEDFEAGVSPRPARVARPREKTVAPEPVQNPPLVVEPDRPTRRMVTEERRLWHGSLRRQRFLAISLGIAAVGALSFGLYVWRFGQVAPVERPPRAVGLPRVEPVRSDAVPSAEEELYRPPSGSGAWVDLSSNVRTRVYVDGRLAGSTPLKRLKVAPGERTLMFESIETGERRAFSQYFRKGQTARVEERFAKAPRR